MILVIRLLVAIIRVQRVFLGFNVGKFLVFYDMLCGLLILLMLFVFLHGCVTLFSTFGFDFSFRIFGLCFEICNNIAK